MIYVDADACPVRAEIERVAGRYGVDATFVTNGGLRPSRDPQIRIVVVSQGADEADKWIADRVGSGDVCITSDLPLAARCIEAGAEVIAHDGEVFSTANIGARLAMRDLSADLRAADPFYQGKGKPFSKADRARFLQSLDAVLSKLTRGAAP